MSENWRYSDIFIAINDKSQGSIAKQLSSVVMGYFITNILFNLLVKEF